MDYNSDFDDQSQPVPVKPHRSFWQKLGAGSLSISLIFHAILLAVGLVWVFKIIPPEPEKVVDFMPKSGGGGSPSAQSQQKKHQVRMAQPNLARVSAKDAIGSITLPEPEENTQMTSLGSLSSGSMSKGLGGNGGGGGKGDGNGPGFGDGLAAGMSDGKGNKNPFGTATLDRGALVGTFYDLKQTSNREPTDMTDDQFRIETADIVKRGFKDSVFRKYFKAPRELYQTKLLIPMIPAEGAPAAFEVEKEVQPRRWIVVYRGAVKPPRAGRFRFVGAGDDLLVVRLNGRSVFDYGYTLASTGTHLFGRGEDMDGTKEEDQVLAKEIRKLSPMKLPISFYKYASTPRQNSQIGGMAVGPEFEVKEGQVCPIEILIGEIPGGSFSVSLLIEEIGATYQKDPAGFPILPLFRLDNSQPSTELKGEVPPFDPNGPIWKFVPGATKRDI
ncbi:MAG: hypothetical protein V4584_03825 [Verrucomicrobiota bacterium]